MNYTIAAPATAADVKEDLLRLMRSNFPWGHEADVWYRWGYEQSPYRPNVCWLVETEARERVGFTSLMPRRMKVGETICDAGQAANLNVAAEHRNALAAVKLQRAVVSHVDQSDMALAFDDFLVNRKTTDFDIYVGLSAGAFLAAPLASGVTPPEMMRSLEGSSEEFTQFLRACKFCSGGRGMSTAEAGQQGFLLECFANSVE